MWNWVRDLAAISFHGEWWTCNWKKILPSDLKRQIRNYQKIKNCKKLISFIVNQFMFIDSIFAKWACFPWQFFLDDIVYHSFPKFEIISTKVFCKNRNYWKSQSAKFGGVAEFPISILQFSYLRKSGTKVLNHPIYLFPTVTTA